MPLFHGPNSNDSSELPPETTSPPASTVRSSLPERRGPGLFESLVWFFGVWGTHLLGSVATAGVLVTVLLTSGMPWGTAEIIEFLSTQQLTLLAGEQFVFVGLVLLAAWWRLGGRLGQRLGSRPMPLEHGFLLTCLILPLAILCTLVHTVGMQGWGWLIERVPALGVMDTLQAMHVMQELQATSSLGAMLLVFAVAPALGEELVFRGVIGRGLIARWGLVWGILITSLLFAAAHVHPVHMLAVIPMGIVLHFVYYTTRSFWAPVYVHFGNNALAVLASRPSGAELLLETLSLTALLTITLSLILFLAMLWQTRVHYVDATGRPCPSPRFQLELPVELPLRPRHSCLAWHVSLGGLVPLIGFLVACRHGL